MYIKRYPPEDLTTYAIGQIIENLICSSYENSNSANRLREQVVRVLTALVEAQPLEIREDFANNLGFSFIGVQQNEDEL